MPGEIAPQTAQDTQDVQAAPQESAPVSDPAVTPESAPAAEPEETPGEQPSSDPNADPENTDASGAEPAGEQTVSLSEHMKLRKRAQEAERRAAVMEGRLQQSTISQQPSSPTKPEGPPPFTPLEEYNGTYEDWLSAKIKHDLAWEQKQQQKVDQASTLDRSFGERCNAAAQTIPDLNETINTAPLPVFDNTVVNAVKKSDLGPQIVYYLAKNPAEAAKLAQMEPELAIMEIGSIREKAKTFVQPITQKGTKAPPPINPGNGTGSTVNVDLADKDMGDYAKSRDADNFVKVGGRLVPKR